MLEARGWRKSCGARAAVADSSLHAGAGEVLSLLGPNGAGKSTTVEMLCGQTLPDAGPVTPDGTVLAAAAFAFKRRIGLLPQDLRCSRTWRAASVCTVALRGKTGRWAAPCRNRREIAA